MFWIGLVMLAWSLIAIGSAFGAWWLLALLLFFIIPRPANWIMVFIWGTVALITASAGCWIGAYVVVAIVAIGYMLSD